MTARDRWAKKLHGVAVRLAVIRDDIDRLGKDGGVVQVQASAMATRMGWRGRRPDEVASYASTGVGYVLAQLQYLEHCVAWFDEVPAARKAKRREKAR